MEENVKASSVSKSDSRVASKFGHSDELLRTNLMLLWELVKQYWWASPNADKILRVTENGEGKSSADRNPGGFNKMHNLMIEALRSDPENCRIAWLRTVTLGRI